MEFEWDGGKAAESFQKHGVSFSEAATVFGDRLSITVFDPNHSSDEEWYLIIGRSARRRLLIVAHTDRGNRIRIISARILTRREQEAYEEEVKNRGA